MFTWLKVKRSGRRREAFSSSFATQAFTCPHRQAYIIYVEQHDFYAKGYKWLTARSLAYNILPFFEHYRRREENRGEEGAQVWCVRRKLPRTNQSPGSWAWVVSKKQQAPDEARRTKAKASLDSKAQSTQKEVRRVLTARADWPHDSDDPRPQLERNPTEKAQNSQKSSRKRDYGLQGPLQV